jgi:hypothetical protein
MGCCLAQSIDVMNQVQNWSEPKEKQNSNANTAGNMDPSSLTATAAVGVAEPIFISVTYMGKKLIINASNWKTMNDAIQSVSKHLKLKPNQSVSFQIWDNDRSHYVYPTSLLQLVSRHKILCSIDDV